MGGYNSYKELINDKTKRLLFPFFLVTIACSVPIKIFSGYYRLSDNLMKDVFIGQILMQGNTHLWFLPTLFFCYVIIYIIERQTRINRKKFCIAFAAISFMSFSMPVVLISNIMQYIFWFYIGYCFEKCRHRINNVIKKYPTVSVLSFILTILLTYVTKKIPNPPGLDLYIFAREALSMPTAAIGCFAAYSICLTISETSLPKSKAFGLFRKNTLGLYLYSDPLNYVILSVFVAYMGSWPFTTNIGAFSIYLIRLLIPSVIAFIICSVLRRIGIRYLS